MVLRGIPIPLSGIRVKNARSAPVGLVLDADVATHANKAGSGLAKRPPPLPCGEQFPPKGDGRGDQKGDQRELTER